MFLERFCVLKKGLDMSYYTIDVVSVKVQRLRSRRSPKTTMGISWFELKEQVEIWLAHMVASMGALSVRWASSWAQS